MAPKLYSSSLQSFARNINNTQLSESLEGLQKYLNKSSLSLLSWDEQHLAIPLNIPVELPPLGTFENIDIREVEPVLIVVNITEYPTIAPKVFADRLDFPKDQLAHLYVAKNGKPPGLCLVRGNFAEWYSNKRLKDLVIRIENWFRDATTGELSEDGNQFDPIRLEGYSGTIIYDYDQIASIVNSNKSFYDRENFAVALFERNETKKGFSYKLTKLITAENHKESYEEFRKEKEKDTSSPSKKYYHYGYVVWSKDNQTYGHYSVNLPENWEGYKEFCLQHGIETSFLEEQIANYDLNVFVLIPVITAVKRPKNIIGFTGNIEFINFTLFVDSNDVKDGKIINNVSVGYQAHNQPLSIQKAQEISGFYAELGKYALIAGCGALGSKITMHLARSGTVSYILADTDIISPHNLVRHTALANAEGMNKAVALWKEIRSIYPYEKLSLTLPFNENGEFFFSPEFAKIFNWVFDFTASNIFFQNLVNTTVFSSIRICRAFISDFGSLGIMFLEGKERNPRIDDLQVMLYAQSGRLQFISDWLKRETTTKQTGVNVTIGVGCNSETTVLADDIVSLHASFFSGVIKTESHKDVAINGKVFLNSIQQEPFFHNSPKLLELPPMEILSAVNDFSWQIRLKPGIIKTLKREMELAMPHETGGVFIGTANYKTKVVHVVDLIKAPPDSKSNAVCFFRGVEGLPEAIKEINELTGNQLGYIGEWHTHPFGPNNMSDTDLNTVKQFKHDFENLQSPLPVFLMIITPTHILPYVF